jgi:hypothetical protein
MELNRRNFLLFVPPFIIAFGMAIATAGKNCACRNWWRS